MSREQAGERTTTPSRQAAYQAISPGLFHAIVESADDAILSKDRNLVITSWNPAATRLYGYSAEEAVGQPISILIPSDHAGEERDILRQVLAGGRVEHYETERVRKDGSRVAVSLTVSAITESDGSISGASVIARNISDQRRNADRAARLQQLTTELAKTVAPEEVVNAALREALSALNADAGAVGLLDEDDETIRVARHSGYAETSLANWETFSVKAALPMSEVVRTGKAAWLVGKEELVSRYPALAGSEIEFRSRAVVPLWAHGRVFGAISLSYREVHRFEPDERTFLIAVVQEAAYALDRAQLHAAEQRARQNLDFLARGSELLAQSLDVETTLQRLADFAVPRLADWCAVDLLSDGEINAVAVAHADPAKVQLARELQQRHPADPDAPVGAPAVIRSGESELHPELTEDLLAAAAPDDEALEIIRGLGLVSAMVVPLRAREKTLGALTLVAAESGRRFTSDDLDVAEDLARRAALAVDNAMLYAREHRAAVTLQRSLLPRDLPRLPGLQLAARYLPAGVGADVGGDWYDTIDLADGRLHLVVGDVAGRGIRAASVMGQLRNALRAYVLDGCAPQEAVGRLNRLARTFESSEMATLVHISFDLRERQAECVRAGHPPPLIRHPNGEVTELAIGGSLPIGVSQGPCPTTTVQIEPGSLVLMYTDGLVERREDGIKPGLEKLKRALRAGPAEPEPCLDFVLHTLTPDGAEDDVALLLMRVDRTADKPLQLTMPAEPSALAPIRRTVEAWLADQQIDLGDGWQIVAACNEACANASEHAYGPTHDGSIEIEARKQGARIVVTVHDHGQWRRARGHDRGRGLTLMNYFMDRVDVERSQEGTTVRMERTVGRGNGT
jgi:PAS domain S-box-containing protein